MALTPSNSGSQPPKPGSRDEAAQDGFLREVDEALREEQMVDAFKRYARPVGLVIAIGLLGLAGYLYWDHAQKAEAAQWSDRTVIAMDRLEAGQLDAALKDLELIARDGGDGHRAVALMQLAGIAAQQGKTDEAVKRFGAIVADAKLPQPVRDLALVRQVSLQFDALRPEEVIARLKPIAVPGNAYFGSAGELVGMAYMEQGKMQQAGELFAQIGRDQNVPATLRSRMRQIASGLGYDAGIENPELVGGGGGDGAAPAPASPAAPQ